MSKLGIGNCFIWFFISIYVDKEISKVPISTNIGSMSKDRPPKSETRQVEKLVYINIDSNQESIRDQSR